MSEQLKEALSAAIDGEASSFELRRVFDEMGKDDELLQAWQSYHLIQQAVHKENVQGVTDMRERIWASLDSEEFLSQDIVQEEPATNDAPIRQSNRWGWVGGAAAAALALAVVVNFSGVFDEAVESGQPRVADVPVGDVQAVEAPATDPRSMYDMYEMVDPEPAARNVPVANRQSTNNSYEMVDEFGEGFDYGPGFVAYGDASPEDQARSDGYFIHHVQQRALNNDSVLSFVKMISYPE